MLYAVEHHKAGRNINSEEISWQQLFKTSEDSLTSFVFERLFYLPVELMWTILTKACCGSELPKQAGKMVSTEFWPHWDAEHTSNSIFIEPDVFIRFSEFDLIIEAKRYDKDQQYQGQWENQIQAYRNEFSDEKPLFYIALGGLFTHETQTVNGIKVVMCRWKSLLEQVKMAHQLLSESEGLLYSSDAILRILSDLKKVFRLHGYATGLWFSSLPFQDYSINSDGFKLSCEPIRKDKVKATSIPTDYSINYQITSYTLIKWDL
ncbi:hypothetical protein [uncultured Sunxiuqinia sp.]|uniref:hypothetical protein n=1 Tax=uncultured Sunxiuqinia sp. TaxID=1573825 RepID=UPI00261FDF2A|nr:hypothetical protein [uncultured Sunxiuqinia sp.]